MSTESLFSQYLSHFDTVDSEDYYSRVLENLPAAVYTCDEEGYIKFYNKAAARLWGREPKIGKDLWCGSWKIYNADGSVCRLSECPMAVALREKRAVPGEEIIIERPNGERRNVVPHPIPIYNSESRMIGATNMLVDVTENKRMQEANKKLELYNEQLDHFAFAASHDLQEPLRKINIFTSLLLNSNLQKINDEGKQYASKILEASGRMTNLISDLLTYSRTLNPEEEFVPTDLNEIIDHVKSDLEIVILEAEAEIITDKLPVIKAVPSQMSRLFFNLINNSLKFSRKKISPVIKITCKTHASYFEITIEDNGIGFDQKHAEKIFDLFERLNDKYSYSGTGLGLSLSKKIVHSHHGEILAEAKKNKGAKFCIRLPLELLV